MSTNFYAKHIPTEQEYQQMQEALIARQLDKLQELLIESRKQYHIGKRSYGWQFMFVPHIDSSNTWHKNQAISPWEDNLDSIKCFLSRDDVQIVDEYGTEFTCEQFFEEIKDILYHDANRAINGSDYNKISPSQFYIPDQHEYTTEEGLRFARDDEWT